MRTLVAVLLLVFSGATLAEDYPCKKSWEAARPDRDSNWFGMHYFSENERYRRSIANTRWLYNGGTPNEQTLAFSSDGCTVTASVSSRSVVDIVQIVPHAGEGSRMEFRSSGKIPFVHLCVDAGSERAQPKGCYPFHDIVFTGGAPLRNEDF